MAEWAVEVVKIADRLSSNPVQLDYVRIAVIALRGPGQQLEQANDFYKLHELIEQNVTEECTPSVVYHILESIDYPQQDLQRIRDNFTVSNFHIWQDFTFDLMLSMISIVCRMDRRSYLAFQTLTVRKFIINRPHSSKITSRADLLQRLHNSNVLIADNVPTFLSYLRDVADYPKLHQYLNGVCERHGITIPPNSSKGNSNGRTRNCGFLCVIVFILSLTLLTVTALGLHIAYRNSHTPYSTRIEFLGDNYTAAPICYNTFQVREIHINVTQSSIVDIYTTAALNVKYSLYVLQEERLSRVPNKTEFDDTLPLHPPHVTLFSNGEEGTVNYRLDLQYTMDQINGCPAQVYLFDSESACKSFISTLNYLPDHECISGEGCVNTSGCLNITGSVNVTFTLLPNTVYHVGMYAAKSVNKSVFVSAELTRINTTGLSKVCSISSSSPCTVSLIGSSYPIHQDSVCVLISSSSSGNVTLTTIPVIWNVYSLSGIIGFPVFLATVVILVVITMALCVRQYCSCRRTYNGAGLEYIAIT